MGSVLRQFCLPYGRTRGVLLPCLILKPQPEKPAAPILLVRQNSPQPDTPAEGPTQRHTQHGHPLPPMHFGRTIYIGPPETPAGQQYTPAGKNTPPRKRQQRSTTGGPAAGKYVYFEKIDIIIYILSFLLSSAILTTKCHPLEKSFIYGLFWHFLHSIRM